MADEILLTPIEEVDDTIRTVLNQLKRELAASYTSIDASMNLDVQDEQVTRIRNLLFTGQELTTQEEAALPIFIRDFIKAGARLPLWDAGLLVDADWVKRYNIAIRAGDQELAMRILVDKEGVPSEPGTVTAVDLPRNKYCEIDPQPDNDYFSNTDRVKALLWYLNYIFFLEQRNFYCPYHMIRERKKRNTIFPMTSPWYFMPTLKGAWELQEVTDRFYTYYNQEMYIPFEVDVDGLRRVGANLKVNNNLITGYVIMVVEGAVGDVKVTLATESIRETYEHVVTPVDLQARMNGISGIGSIELTDYSDKLLAPSALVTYTRQVYTFTVEQVGVFAMAFYGDYATKPEWVTLNIAPERRITLSGWTQEYEQWLSIHKSVSEVFLDILILRPLGEIVDFPSLEQTIAPDLLQAKAPLQTNTLQEDALNRLVDIIREDDAITQPFRTLMGRVDTYIAAAIGKHSALPVKETDADKVARTRSETLFGTREGLNIELYELPPFWSLQRVSLQKFGTADYWRDIADLNNIGNPLDEVEMFEGRRLALPRSAADKVR